MTCFSFTAKRRKTSRLLSAGDEEISGFHNVKIYSYKELKRATDGFSPANKVGEGGFGCVYKGTLRNGKIVAIKVLSSVSRQGVQEFLNELVMISNIFHENLVTLYGCCVEGNQRILVYNYLENNSLSKMLLSGGDSNVQFNWKTRAKICIGVARGLAFLHDELLPANMSHVSTRVAGTIGYLAPEYAIHGQLTRKADIYSFGVLLLEIISGRCNTNKRLPCEDHYLLERTWALYEKGELERMIDTSLGSDLNAEEAGKFLRVGLICTQDSAKLRPPMSMIVKMLAGEVDVSSFQVTKPAMITDFMELKVRKADQHHALQIPSRPSAAASIIKHSLH